MLNHVQIILENIHPIHTIHTIEYSNIHAIIAI